MKKFIATMLVVVIALSASVNVLASGYNYGYNNNGYGYNNYNYGYNNNGYGYNNNYGYGNYGYYNCTGMRQTYSDQVFQYSPWFTNEFEQYGTEFHVYPTMPISRSDVFAPIGKAMERAYDDSNRTFSNNFGVPFRDFTWDPELASMAGGLYQRGIMSGYPEDNTVRFVNNITREEFAKVLVTTAKNNGIYSVYNNINSTFTDIKDSWAKQYIEECNAMGLMYGKSATVFAPQDMVTYEEYVAIMLRMANRTNGGYSFDVEDIAYGISNTMDIDFVDVEIAEDDFTLSAYGTKTIYMSVGETETVKVKASPSDVELKKSDVDWETNKSGYLKLGNDYVEDDRYILIDIKALKEGKVTLTATASYDEDESVEFTVVISDDEEYEEDDIFVTSIVLNPTAVNLNVGQNKAITATVKPSNATDKSITWESHNTSVATVDKNGKITAVGVGSTTVTATANDGSGVVATIDVTVTAEQVVSDAKAPVVQCLETVVVNKGSKGKFKVTAHDENLKSFDILQTDVLGITKLGIKIIDIEKVSNNTIYVHYEAVETCSGELSIAAGVAVDEAGNTSAESLGVYVCVNPID